MLNIIFKIKSKLNRENNRENRVFYILYLQTVCLRQWNVRQIMEPYELNNRKKWKKLF